ncbi:MAG: hypothetical protein AB8C84_04430 [Oligoflexales bacterium]
MYLHLILLICFINTTHIYGQPLPEKRVSAGSAWNPGHCQKSSCGRFEFEFCKDGKLRLFDLLAKTRVFGLIWEGGAKTEDPRCCQLQQDGNLVVYNNQFNPVWSSQTNSNEDAFLQIQQDGNVVIYSKDHKPLWQTGTAGTLKTVFWDQGSTKACNNLKKIRFNVPKQQDTFRCGMYSGLRMIEATRNMSCKSSLDDCKKLYTKFQASKIIAQVGALPWDLATFISRVATRQAQCLNTDSWCEIDKKIKSHINKSEAVVLLLDFDLFIMHYIVACGIRENGHILIVNTDQEYSFINPNTLKKDMEISFSHRMTSRCKSFCLIHPA